MALAYLIFGTFFGCLLTVVVQVFFFVKYVAYPLLKTPQAKESTESRKIDSQPDPDGNTGFRAEYDTWPKAIAEFLKKALKTDDNSSDVFATEVWMNALIHRYFVECRRSEILRLRLKQKLMAKISKRFRFESNGILIVGPQDNDLFNFRLL